MNELIKLVEECNDCLKSGKTVAEAFRTIYERLSNAIDEEIVNTYKMTEEEAKEHFKESIDVWEIGKDISFSSLGKLDKDFKYITNKEYKQVMEWNRIGESEKWVEVEEIVEIVKKKLKNSKNSRNSKK